MHTSKADIPAQQMGDYEGRMTDFREWRIAFESMPAHFPPDESIFKGLPDDRCQCLHLGYLIKGSVRINYRDGREEVVRAGEAYVLEPGHFLQTLEATELLEFSPRDEHEVTMAAIAKNMGAVV